MSQKIVLGTVRVLKANRRILADREISPRCIDPPRCWCSVVPPGKPPGARLPSEGGGRGGGISEYSLIFIEDFSKEANLVCAAVNAVIVGAAGY